MVGLRKYPPVLDEQWFSDLVDFLGGPTAASQLTTGQIILAAAAGSPLLSTWQHTSDKSKIDAAKIYQTVLMSPLSADLDFAGYKAIDVLLEILASDPASPATSRLWYRSDTEKVSIRRASVTDRFVLETLEQTLTNKTLTSPMLTTPTIASFVNAAHNHQDAAGGGTLLKVAITDFAHGSSLHSGSVIPAADQDFQEYQALAFRVENLASLPAAGNKGRLVCLTTDNKVYYDNGTTWVAM